MPAKTETATTYAEAVAELKKHEKPQDDLIKELLGENETIYSVISRDIRILLQTILDLRAERDAGYSNVA